MHPMHHVFAGASPRAYPALGVATGVAWGQRKLDIATKRPLVLTQFVTCYTSMFPMIPHGPLGFPVVPRGSPWFPVVTQVTNLPIARRTLRSLNAGSESRRPVAKRSRIPDSPTATVSVIKLPLYHQQLVVVVVVWGSGTSSSC